jgi:Metallo-beta-lactamase superfamily
MAYAHRSMLSRRGFCLCCLGSATFTATAGWLTPSQVFARAQGIVDSIRSAAAAAPINVHALRGNVSVLEGSGGNIAVLTGLDGRVLVDAGIGVSRPRIAAALASLSPDPIRHLINTHWHFDHADGNEWLRSEGAVILAHDNARKHLAMAQRVEDWDFDFPPSPPAAIPTEVLSGDRTLRLNGSTLALKYYGPADTDGDISVTFEEPESELHDRPLQTADHSCRLLRHRPGAGRSRQCLACGASGLAVARARRRSADGAGGDRLGAAGASLRPQMESRPG